MLTDHLNEFSEYLRANKARMTRRTYLCRISKYLSTLKDDSEFTTLSVRAYKDKLGETLRPRAVASHVAAIRAFARWMVETERLSADPTASVKTPKLDDPQRDTPTDDDIADLFDNLHRIARPYRRALAAAVLSVLAYAGIRRGELLALKVSDIDLKRSLLHVRHGKGDKPRVVPFGAECRDALAAYLAVRPAAAPGAGSARSEDALWLWRVGVALGDDGLQALLREIYVAAGRDPQHSKALLPHGLRHAFATRMYEGCKDLVKVGGYLGHADPSTTANYVHTKVDSLREIVQYSALRRSESPSNEPPPPADRPLLRLVSSSTDTPRGA